MILIKLFFILPVFGMGTQMESLFGRAQVAYSQNDFDSFFGITEWVHLTNWSELSPQLKDQWQALEIMGLARHCRFQEISETKPAGTLSQKALQLVQLKKEYKQFIENEHNHKKPFLADTIERSQMWKITQEDFKKIKSPENLKSIVKSECL